MDSTDSTSASVNELIKKQTEDPISKLWILQNPVNSFLIFSLALGYGCIHIDN